MSAGDVFAQGAAEYLEPQAAKGGWAWDAKRTASMAGLGLCCHAPYFHFWYKWLDSRFVGTSMKQIVPKLVLELTTAGPGYLSIVLAYTTMVRTSDPSKIWPKMKADFLMMYSGGVAFHGVVQAFNFRFVPSSQRILYDNCTGLMWKAFLSMVANR
jgi:hypothetical protein